MHVIVFANSRASWQVRAAQAFGQGLRVHGIEPELAEPCARACDLAVVWSHRHHRIHEMQRAHGGDYLVMEAGYVGDRLQWVSLGYNGLNGRADFCNQGAPGDRWQRHHAHRMKPWRALSGDGYGLIMGQVPGDEGVREVDLAAFYAQAAADIRALGYLPLFRPHPKAPETQARGVGTLHNHTLADALGGAEFVVAWNSNSAVDAVLAGVPAVVMDRGSMAWPVAGHSLCALPPQPEREQWAHELAYAQWTHAEMASGEAWAHLKQRCEANHAVA